MCLSCCLDVGALGGEGLNGGRGSPGDGQKRRGDGGRRGGGAYDEKAKVHSLHPINRVQMVHANQGETHWLPQCPLGVFRLPWKSELGDGNDVTPELTAFQ